MLTILRGQHGKTLYDTDAALLPGLLSNAHEPFWLDLQSPTPEEFSVLSNVFQFHPLAIEDAARPHQRPKVDEYENFVFLTADEITLTLEDLPEEDRHSKESSNPDAVPVKGKTADDEDDVQARQIALFLGANFLVTIHLQPARAVQDLRARCDQNGRIIERGADFILYTLLDALVDSYFPLLDTLDDATDALEDRVFSTADGDVLGTIFAMKRDVARMRRFAGPLRQAVETLTERNIPNIRESTLPYLRDVADHLFRVYEHLDNHRDLVSNLLDAHLSQVSNRMNRIMQKISVIGAIFLPLTFLTGLFGMNFDREPWAKSNPMVWLGVMVAFAVVVYLWFRRRDWV